MTYQAYLDTIKAKTGKTPADFAKLAAKKKLTQYGELMTWLKQEYALGHGHANVIAHEIQNAGQPKETADDRFEQLFGGAKAAWRKPYEALVVKLGKLGDDFAVAPTKSYISLLRGTKKFGVVAVTADRLDVGIKLKGVPAAGRLEASGDWNAMVTHRVRVSDAKQLNAELLAWLKQAYQQAA